MNGLILLTAMSATGGLFGGHQARTVCVGGSCGTIAAAPSARVAYAPAAAPVYYTQPSAQYAPTPQAVMATQQAYHPTAPVAPRVSYLSYYSVGSACVTGNCPRR